MEQSSWFHQSIQPLNQAAKQAAKLRQTQLTKPAGSLGRLEELAVRLTAMQAREFPKMNQAWVSVFAGDHGLAQAGVSAFPAEVTAQMVHNFLHGGAAIAVLAKQQHMDFEVVDVGVSSDFQPQPYPEGHKGLVIAKVAKGTASSLDQAAMSHAQCLAALEAGKQAAERAFAAQADCFIGGEMGIGNTSAASLLIAKLTGHALAPLVGAGTGLDSAGVERKRAILAQVLEKHAAVESQDALAVLATFGGFEIAALAGAYIRCAQLGLPVLVDGVISSAAALVAEQLCPGAKDWWIFSHLSVEPAHQVCLNALGAQPLLQLDLRLGEGSGAALAWPLVQQACWLHNQMATFAEAAVSES
ncbi:nicotinate-nucleotide--dimethylbenzimidazole phosphoribosyltransferase [Thiomicrospira sp. R3]|uniref:nicotinate-nucleotide--dimethylbenzimidazole phosphoribosyltransferase n=1 Tax=Thiomicrospira sp. R3 TaxID=3035472 RepID=UPI00259B4970|nr:nicotinate-nucleotide--dimethylbenzimidazole phosphoribosyltransferase [Thiomicrospira sp. R3]WFE68186.1 nicotinate-nucleotide--dimethylbenzimidazole phosphoribosyltransferase [Thiomicrospira sp. R3]